MTKVFVEQLLALPGSANYWQKIVFVEKDCFCFGASCPDLNSMLRLDLMIGHQRKPCDWSIEGWPPWPSLCTRMNGADRTLGLTPHHPTLHGKQPTKRGSGLTLPPETSLSWPSSQPLPCSTGSTTILTSWVHTGGASSPSELLPHGSSLRAAGQPCSPSPTAPSSPWSSSLAQELLLQVTMQ